MKSLVSIVVPMFNEEENAGPLCAAVRSALDGWDHPYELVLVDDGSSDRTVELLRAEAAGDPRIRVISLLRNSGQTLAMATGFARAKGGIIVSMDGDLQNDPLDIPQVVRELERGYDVVCGWRKNRQDKWLSRTLPSKIANRIIAWMTGVPIHDNGCSLKAYRASLIQSLRLYSDMHRFLPALSSMAGARIKEVVVRHHPRVHGESKYGISRTFKVLADMVTIKMLTQFSQRPGTWFSMLGLIPAGLGITCLAVWFSRYPAGGHVVYSSLAVMLLFTAGYLVSLGMIGEMLLAQTDRGFLKRLVEVLAVRTSGRTRSSRIESQEDHDRAL